MPQTRSDSLAQWWGNFVIARSSVTRWQIGPLTLSAQRLAGEWRLGYESADDPLSDTSKRAPNLNAATLDQMAAVERFAVSGESEEVRLEPRPANRPIVSRPDRPFHVLPGEEVTLYVGSPLWVAVSSVSPQKALIEIPTHRPSDTWFGPPTADGELCYASRTFCRLVLDEVPRRPHRAVTAVLIRNPSKEPLPILRLKLPMEQLGLFAAGDGRVWTHDVIFERGEGTEFAQLQIGERAPSAAKDAKSLLPPRVRSVGNPVVRAFSSLFS
jgi:hypothetical protein